MIGRYAAATGALVLDTFRESLSRKIFWGFLGCSTVLMLLFLLVLHIDIVEGGVAAIKIFGQDFNAGQDVEIGTVVNAVLGGVSVFLFTAGLFFSVFASAGLIPTIFEPGRIELLLSKPISRPHLLLGKFLGTLAVIGCNLFYLVFGVWVILGLKTDIWQADFLASASLAVYAFAVLLTVVLFVAVAFAERGAGDDGDLLRDAAERNFFAAREHWSLFQLAMAAGSGDGALLRVPEISRHRQHGAAGLFGP